MPTSVGPNTFGEENLVFGYDLGDVRNSYRGEPVYNYHDYDKSVMNQTGFNNWSCYDGNYTASYHTWGIAQSRTFVTVDGPDGKDTGAMLYHNFDGGFYGPTDWGGVPAAICTAGNKVTVQGWVKAADAASVGKTVTPYLYFSLNAGGAEAGASNFNLTENWQLVSHTHTLSAAASNYNNILYFFTNAGSAVRMYLTKIAILSGKDHAVQWVPGGTARSASGSLADLTGNSTIDLTNVSFDSNAQMTFDGTNDYVGITNTPQTLFNNNESHSFSLWLKKAGSNSGNYAYVYDRYGTYRCPGLLFELNSNTLVVEWRRSDNGTWIYNSSGLSVETGVWNFVTVTIEAPGSGLTKTMKVYLYKSTGLETATMTNTADWNAGTDGNFVIGKSISNNTYFNGYVKSVRTYDRVLTASEIQSNYNALKGRFNI